MSWTAAGWLCSRINERMNAGLCLNNPLCELAEGPLWHPGEEALYWTDINGRRLWRFTPAKGRTELVGKER